MNDLLSLIFVFGLIWTIAFSNIAIEIERIRRNLERIRKNLDK